MFIWKSLFSPFGWIIKLWSIMLNLILKDVVEPFYVLMVITGNTNWRGRLSTVDLHIKVACFVKKEKNQY